MKIAGLMALAGAAIGVVVGVVLHALVWRPSGPVGFYSFSRPRRYADYLFVGGGHAESLSLRLHLSGGFHTAWWPLLLVTVVVGLVTGALLGGLVAGYRTSRRSSGPQPG